MHDGHENGHNHNNHGHAHGHDHDHEKVHPHHEGANPVLVEVTRGDMVESRHRGAAAVVDSEGRVVFSAGDVEALIYGRSAIKPLQALALVETGAAEAFDCSDAEIALACASHDAEPFHVAGVKAWLERMGLSADDLECGAHRPDDRDAADALIRAGQEPSSLHNNCSGKHAGFLAVAKILSVPTKGYIEYSHPVQQTLLGIMEMMSGLDLRGAPRGIDGCGIPQIAMPLGNIALAMARMAEPDDQPERRQKAAARVLQSMERHPEMVAGTHRYCTKVMQATKGRALIKTGAEGVYCGVIPELGLGLCVKIDDGGTRAAEVATG